MIESRPKRDFPEGRTPFFKKALTGVERAVIGYEWGMVTKKQESVQAAARYYGISEDEAQKAASGAWQKLRRPLSEILSKP